MDIPDRPPLDPYELEQLELKLHEIDKRWWIELQMMTFSVSRIETTLGSRTAGPLPPKRPLQLKRHLQSYAIMLFNEEASSVIFPNVAWYPRDPQSRHWQSKLAERVEARVLLLIAKLSDSFALVRFSTYDLDYHGVTQSEMRQCIRECLKRLIEAKLAPEPRTEETISTKTPAPIAESNEAPPSQPQPIPGTSEIQRREVLLAEYKAATGDQADYRIYNARNSGIHKPEFYQWKKGVLPKDSGTTKNFERFLREKKIPIPRKP
jgi:hypothetical protein